MSQEETLTKAEKKEVREKLKEKFGPTTRTGGKGKHNTELKGTERRKS